jgi:hypothetical protein
VERRGSHVYYGSRQGCGAGMPFSFSTLQQRLVMCSALAKLS